VKIRLILLIAISLTPLLLASPAVSIADITGNCLHLIRFCFATFSRIDTVLHAIPWSLAALGVALAVVRRVHPVLSVNRLIRRLPSRLPHSNELIGELAAKHGVAGRIRIFAGPSANPVFTAGMITPYVYISEVLQTTLHAEELETVVLHEAHHLRRRDPLRYLIAAILADFLFWVPLVRDGLASLAARLEFAADDAARSVGDLVLASAILRVADLSQEQQLAAACFVTPDLLQRRLNRLLGKGEEPFPRVNRHALGITGTALLLLWFVGIASSAAHAGHTSDPVACTHHHHGVLHDASTPHTH
jgi:Zn-dependent protease with chaperone function